MRYQCPILTSRVEYDPDTKIWKRAYELADDERVLEWWMHETFNLIRTGQQADEFVMSDTPVPNAAIFVFPGKLNTEQVVSGTYKYEIIFRSGHDVIDGMATYALLDNLMRHAAYAFECKDGGINVLFGDEYKKLFPPFRVALGLPPETFDSLARARVDAIRDQRIKDRTGALSFPCKRGVSVLGKTHRVVVAFTVEESKAVLAACKLREPTATPVFHSAIALAMRDLQPRETSPREGKYVSYVIST
jgi:hypothetical protein